MGLPEEIRLIRAAHTVMCREWPVSDEYSMSWATFLDLVVDELSEGSGAASSGLRRGRGLPVADRPARS